MIYFDEYLVETVSLNIEEILSIMRSGVVCAYQRLGCFQPKISTISKNHNVIQAEFHSVQILSGRDSDPII